MDKGYALKAGNPVTKPYCNSVERLIGISPGYLGTVIVEFDLRLAFAQSVVTYGI